MLSALILNQLSFPAVLMLYIILVKDTSLYIIEIIQIHIPKYIYLIFGHINNR
jgi:hypothetical protein